MTVHFNVKMFENFEMRRSICKLNLINEKHNNANDNHYLCLFIFSYKQFVNSSLNTHSQLCCSKYFLNSPMSIWLDLSVFFSTPTSSKLLNSLLASPSSNSSVILTLILCQFHDLTRLHHSEQFLALPSTQMMPGLPGWQNPVRQNSEAKSRMFFLFV